MIQSCRLSTRIGVIGLCCNADGTFLTELHFRDEAVADVVPEVAEEDLVPDVTDANVAPILKKTAEELLEYLNGERVEFDIPCRPERGTPFQRKVWEALKDIPYGETCTYQDIAVRIGCPKGCRAVGNANNRNPIAIIVPCHRVIGANHKLVGYAGGLEVKRLLLELESNQEQFRLE